MTLFTPPDVPENVPVLDHIFASTRAISSWNRHTPRFQKITMHRVLAEAMVREVELHYGRPVAGADRTVYGMDIEQTENWSREPRSYTITYEVQR